MLWYNGDLRIDTYDNGAFCEAWKNVMLISMQILSSKFYFNS